MFSSFGGEENPVSELSSLSCVSFSFPLFSFEYHSFVIRIDFIFRGVRYGFYYS